MLDIIPSSGSKNDTSMKPMNIQSRITMAGSITDMNRDSLASVSSSQDVHICCMTSSIDPVLLPIAIQLEYIFEKILECSSASENVSPLDIFLRQSFILESRTGLREPVPDQDHGLCQVRLRVLKTCSLQSGWMRLTWKEQFS